MTGTHNADYGLEAGIMYFQRGSGGCTHSHHHDKVIGTFPDQRTAIRHLLIESEDNPLTQSCPPDRLRYFHLPTNSMAWAEASRRFPRFML